MCLGNQSEKKSPPASRVVRRGKTVDINPLLATLARRVSHLAGDTVRYHLPILRIIATPEAYGFRGSPTVTYLLSFVHDLEIQSTPA